MRNRKIKKMKRFVYYSLFYNSVFVGCIEPTIKIVNIPRIYIYCFLDSSRKIVWLLCFIDEILPCFSPFSKHNVTLFSHGSVVPFLIDQERELPQTRRFEYEIVR